MRHGEPRNFVQPCLLLLLLEHPDHGYALVERLKCFLPAEGDPGSVYRALHALEVGGAVRSTWGLSESGPARRTYHLTEMGRSQLDEWAGSISDTRQALETYLARYAGNPGTAGNTHTNPAGTAGGADTAQIPVVEPARAPRPSHGRPGGVSG
ncbi:MAG: helix-turn-helix transcriptional regulator [Geodermatophilaceae bacterium]|nr:helix-turn-helix transcriptional regulator [Geodermatophilaceae bacterium]MDQ3463495.1 helix-turn-helix transcriptional regulator [Actinomycetota bacterium]